MRKAVRWAVRVALALASLLVAVWLLQHAIIKSIAEHRLSRKTGLPVRIGELKASWVSGNLVLRDVRIFNGPGFGATLLLRIPEASCSLDLRQTRTNRLHFAELKLHLSELNVIRNRNGVVNLASAQDSITRHAGPELQTNRRWIFKFGGIDRLDLTLGKVNYIDERQPAKNRSFDLGVDHESVTNLQTEEDFNRWLTAFLLRTAVQGYANKAEAKATPTTRQ